MLFDARHFEQFFDERVLLKGLRLFEKGKVAFIGGHSGFEQEFLVDKTVSLSLKKKGDKLLSYTCSCNKQELCEHVSAALFYLQQDALGLSEKKQRDKKSRKKPGTTEKIKRSVKTKYEVYAAQFKNLLKPYLKNKSLIQTQLDGIATAVLKLQRNAASLHEHSDYFNLALLTELPAVFEWRSRTADDATLRHLHALAQHELEQAYNAGLSKAQTASWYKATLDSVKSNLALNSEAFVFLMPRTVSRLHDKADFNKLSELLNKRRLKKNYLYYFDKLLIAKLQLAIKEAKAFNTTLLSNHAHAVEFVIAQAELYFCNGANDKAFKLLKKNYDTVKKSRPFYFNGYLDYVIDHAHQKNKTDVELYFLRESFMHSLGITPAHYERFMALTPKKEQADAIDAIIVTLKNQPAETFDKIADLLLRTGRLDELLKELKKQKNKFGLLHRVILLKLPYYDTELFELYAGHLARAISEAGTYSRNYFLDKAREYINRLPATAGDELLVILSDKIGGFKQAYRALR